MKGSLFVVTLEHGAYSDWEIEHYLFSGNDENEVWEFVKIWATENPPSEWQHALIWGDKRYEYRRKKKIDWDNAYGDAFEVNIKRAEVIYVDPHTEYQQTNVIMPSKPTKADLQPIIPQIPTHPKRISDLENNFWKAGDVDTPDVIKNDSDPDGWKKSDNNKNT